MKNPEVTSKAVAAIAGQVLQKLQGQAFRDSDRVVVVSRITGKRRDMDSLCSVKQLKALAGSDLTQREKDNLTKAKAQRANV